MDHCEICGCQYADDTWFALEPTEESLNALIDELDQFAQFAGLTINFSKSYIMKLGPLRESDARFYTMKQVAWTDDPIKILGVWIFPEWAVMHQLNYENTLKKIDSILSTWEK